MPFLWVGQGTLIGSAEREIEREKLRQGPHQSKKEFAEMIAVST